MEEMNSDTYPLQAPAPRPSMLPWVLMAICSVILAGIAVVLAKKLKDEQARTAALIQEKATLDNTVQEVRGQLKQAQENTASTMTLLDAANKDKDVLAARVKALESSKVASAHPAKKKAASKTAKRRRR